MVNVNQPATGGSKIGMWVALIIAVIVLGVGGYLLFAQDNGANTNNRNVAVNTVTDANSNSAANENVNSATNVVNTVVNTNSNENTNLDVSDWEVYQSDNVGVIFGYPSNWEVIQDSVQDAFFFIQITDPKYIHDNTEYPSIIISRYTAASNQSLTDWVSNRLETSGYSSEISDISTGSGLMGVNYRMSNNTHEFVFKKGESVFVVAVSDFSRNDIQVIGEGVVDSLQIK